ncbi:MAG: hypothetical protein WBC70_16500 [Candidatus Aminicenantales bacterium]
MSRLILSSDIPRVSRAVVLCLFPALFIIALLFPPLLLLLPAAVLSIVILFEPAPPRAPAKVFSAAVRLPGRRGPPLGV